MFALRLSAEPLFFAYRVLKLVLLHAMLRAFSAIHVVHDLDFTVCAASLLVLYGSFLSSLLMNICQTVIIGKQSRTAALGLLIYEHIITIEDEIDLIWLKRKSWVTYLYHFNRWLPVLWLTFDLIRQTPYQVVSSKTCVTYMLCNNIIALLTTISIQTILQLRVWAIYDRSRRILSWMIILSTIEVAAMALLIGLTIVRVEKFPVVSTPVGCLFEGLAPLSAIFWTPALILEPIICILVLKKVFLDRQRRTELATFLARDSLLYFLVIFMQLIASTIVWARFPSYIDLFMPWSVALPSLLCNRLLLNMRGRFARGSEPVRSSLLIELATLRTSADSLGVPDEE